MSRRPAERILSLLKTEGPLTAADLAETLEVTAVAVRQHLGRLEEEGLVGYEDVPHGVGRPRRTWHLLAPAQQHFPDRHGELTRDLIGAMHEAFGTEGLDRLLAERTRKQRAAYKQRMPARGAPLGRFVRALARIRSEEGYMAVVERDRDGSYLLIENHCPICAAAEICQGLCREELALFESLLPPRTQIAREEHLLAGERRCVYRIAAA